MELGFVDEDDPFPVLIQGQRAQEQEEFKLTGAEQVHFKTRTFGSAEIDIKKTDSGLRWRDDLHGEGLRQHRDRIPATPR